MKSFFILTSLLLALTVSAISESSPSRVYHVRVEARTSIGYELHTLDLEVDKGYGYIVTAAQNIREARVLSVFEDVEVTCFYTADEATQDKWLSQKFTNKKPLTRPFDAPTGLICLVPDEHTVRIAVYPPVEGGRVLNVDMPKEQYSQYRIGVNPLFNTYGNYVRIERAAIVDQPIRINWCSIRHEDNTGFDWDHEDLEQVSRMKRPLERVTELVCHQYDLY